MEFSIPLNKFEKWDLILRLWDEGKTYQEIADSINLLIQSHKLLTSQGVYNMLNKINNRLFQRIKNIRILNSI